jgi:hypothetical protein
VGKLLCCIPYRTERRSACFLRKAAGQALKLDKLVEFFGKLIELRVQLVLLP